MKRGIAALAVLLLPALTSAADLGRHFQGVRGAFVLLDGPSGRYTRYNARLAATRYPPCSTFKIPNSAIALETGVAPDPEYVVRYDPALKLEGRGPNGAWGRDQSLRGAFQTSVLWYYQEMARRVGPVRMAQLVRQFRYGDSQTSGPVDRFWIDGTLRISADEQVDFLRRFHAGRIGVSERTTRLVKEIMVADRGPGWSLSAKTGTCRPEGEADYALWYAGYVERAGTVSYFALLFLDREIEPLFTQRIPRARAILKDLGVLP